MDIVNEHFSWWIVPVATAFLLLIVLYLRRPPAALCLARHGVREDYAAKARGENWQSNAERPWDPPLTANGVEQGGKLGSGIRGHLRRMGRRPITKIISSPLLRCVQTAAAAAEQLGVGEICVEPELTEGMLEAWYRSWAVPGADSTWGGPQHSRVGTPFPAHTDVHPLAHRPGEALLFTPEMAAEALTSMGVRVGVSRTYEPIQRRLNCSKRLNWRWRDFETDESLAERMGTALNAIASKYPGESILCCSHGGPCAHAYEQLVPPSKQLPDVQAGYTALYIFVRDGEGVDGWAAPVVADQSHLTDGLRDAPDVADLNGPNDSAEQAKVGRGGAAAPRRRRSPARGR